MKAKTEKLMGQIDFELELLGMDEDKKFVKFMRSKFDQIEKNN